MQREEDTEGYEMGYLKIIESRKPRQAFGNNVRSKSCLQPFFKQLFHPDVSGA